MRLRLSYYPDITQKQTGEDVRRAVEVYAAALGADLSATFGKAITLDVLPVREVPKQFEEIVAGECEIALMKPVAYVFAHRRNASILPACVAYRPIDGQVGTSYYGQVYARRSLGLSTLADLAKQPAERLRIAYGSRYSTSNFLVPAQLLRASGVHPFLFFRQVTFLGGHDLAAESVYRGDCDIGCGHDGVIKILAQAHPDAEDALVQLGRRDIHSDPVVVHSGILPEALTVAVIQEASARVAKRSDVKAALDLFWGWVKDLGPTKHVNYASIEEALADLCLSEQDMLG